MSLSNRNLPLHFVNLVVGLCLFTLAPSTSLGATEMSFRWSPSPLWDESGEALAPAVAYEVWLSVDHGISNLVATVPGTTYTVSADPGKTYNLSVRGVCAEGHQGPMSLPSDDCVAPSASTVAAEWSAGLASAYPNPFNPRTAITFHVPGDLTDNTPLSLEIFDMRGRLVRRFTPDRSPGTHSVIWNGVDTHGAAMPSGIYVARYLCGAVSAALKITLVR